MPCRTSTNIKRSLHQHDTPNFQPKMRRASYPSALKWPVELTHIQKATLPYFASEFGKRLRGNEALISQSTGSLHPIRDQSISYRKFLTEELTIMKATPAVNRATDIPIIVGITPTLSTNQPIGNAASGINP